MADNLNIYKFCGNCKGTGKIQVGQDQLDEAPTGEVDCSFCNGTGELFWGQMREVPVE